MAFTAKVLADGQLPTSLTALYTCPALSAAYVKRIRIVNTNAASQTVLIYKRATGTSDRLLGRAVLAQWEAFVIESEILEAADQLLGQTTTATAVDYTIDGVLEA